MDRRKFLKIGVGGVAGVLAATTFGTGIAELSSKLINELESHSIDFLKLLQSPKAATPRGATEICLKADALADAIEPLFPSQFRTKEDAQLFVWEAAPYAVYERLLPKDTNYGVEGTTDRIMLPTRERLVNVDWIHYGGDSSFHILGTAPCFDPDNPNFNINIRFFNPASPLYNRPSTLASVIIHEMVHMEGVCSDGSQYDKDVETATQIGTLEILAAMTRHSNLFGLLPFIREIQGYAADVVYLWALENDQIDFYRSAILRNVHDNAFKYASFEKSLEHWQESYSSKFRLVEILKLYGVQPYHYILEALQNEGYETRKMPYPNRQRTIKLDDTAYVLEHMVELARDYHLLVEGLKGFDE